MFRERNIVAKRGRPGDIRVAIAYPGPYEVAVASLVHQMLYYAVNSLEGYVGERVVDTPEPRGIEWGTPLRDFHLILFSLHYEPDYATMVSMLERGGVNPFRGKRGGRPLVAVGGPPVIANPRPLEEIADVVIVGEMEPTLRPLLEAVAQGRSGVENLAGKEGFYVPGVSDRVVRAFARVLDPRMHPVAQIQPVGREPVWGRTLIVEAMRGCFRGCRFCMEGCVFRPKRDRDAEQVLRIVEEGVEANRVRKVTFYSLSFFDHREADRILREVGEMGLEASVPSVRMETLSEERLELVASLGQKTLTIAPETASPVLGRALLKPREPGDLEELAAKASKAGIRNLKLYYMVGLPGEGRGDVEAIAREVAGIRRMFSRVVVSLNPFMPKPQTPMQYFPLEDLRVLRGKIRLVKSLLGRAGVEVRHYDPRWAAVQVAIARAGGDAGRLIVQWAREGGGLGGWRRALVKTGFRPRLGPLGPGESLPWSIVDMRLGSYRLEEQYSLYLRELRGASTRTP